MESRLRWKQTFPNCLERTHPQHIQSDPFFFKYIDFCSPDGLRYSGSRGKRHREEDFKQWVQWSSCSFSGWHLHRYCLNICRKNREHADTLCRHKKILQTESSGRDNHYVISPQYTCTVEKHREAQRTMGAQFLIHSSTSPPNCLYILERPDIFAYGWCESTCAFNHFTWNVFLSAVNRLPPQFMYVSASCHSSRINRSQN